MRKKILSSKNVVIVPHANADPDALASACALAYSIKHMNETATAIVLIAEGIGLESRKMIEVCYKHGISVLIIKKRSDLKDKLSYEEDDLCILVDTASTEQIKIVKNYLKPCKHVTIIDHHDFHDYDIDLENKQIIKLIDSNSSSTSEIVFLILNLLNIVLPKDLLELLLAGIIWDTKRFLRVSSKTFSYIARLLELGAEYEKAHQLIITSKPYYARMAKIKCVLRHRGYRLSLGSEEIYVALSEVGAYESDCATTLINIGYDIAIVASEEDEVKAMRIVYRAREDNSVVQNNIDVYNDVLKKITQKFGGGGGGHRTAGAIVVNTTSFPLVFREIVEILNKLSGDKLVELAENKIFY